VKQTTLKAIELCQSAAKEGDVKAQHNLAIFYENGRFVVSNRRKAFKLPLRWWGRNDVLFRPLRWWGRNDVSYPNTLILT